MFLNKTDKISANKIVSLVPSLTELLFDLGLEKKIKGITKFCKYPKNKINNVEKIGGTKNINIEKIKKINPDLIIANKEENTQNQIEELAKYYNVYLTDINTFSNALSEIKNIGKLTNTEQIAKDIIDKINKNFSKVTNLLNNKTFAFFIWNNPLMIAGNDTFISDILKKIGGKNVYDFKTDRYPQTTILEIEKLNPDYIFLSTEPYKFTEVHKKLFNNLVTTKKIIVNGEYFIWYGSRLIKSPDYFINLFKN